jgi:hypothetical protein
MIVVDQANCCIHLHTYFIDWDLMFRVDRIGVIFALKKFKFKSGSKFKT